MEVQRLRILRELAARGTITAVAEALSFTPSAISQQVHALERETGLALVERRGRRLQLTEAGLALVGHAHQVLAALERAEVELEGYRAGRHGRVRIAIFPSMARLLLPGVLSRAEDVPGLVLDCRDLDIVPDEAVGLTAEFDIVVAHRDATAPPFTGARVEVEPLLREPVDVVLPSQHPLARRRSVDAEAVAEERIIGVGVGLPLDDLLTSLAGPTGVRPVVVQRINDFRVTEALVEAGHGVALLPRYAIHDQARRRLARRPFAGVHPACQVDALIRAGMSQRPAVRTTLDALHAEAEALTGGKEADGGRVG